MGQDLFLQSNAADFNDKTGGKVFINNIDVLQIAKDNLDNAGKVKLSAESAIGYLIDLISTNLAVEGGKLEVLSLKNLVASVLELNYLQGATSNIQAQINALVDAANFIGVSPTRAQIETLFPEAEEKDYVIVSNDETHNGVTTIWVFNGIIWQYVGDFDVEMRDFSTQPINLQTEVTGKLLNANINDTLVQDVADNKTARHSHTNKSILDLLDGTGTSGQYFGGDGTFHNLPTAAIATTTTAGTVKATNVFSVAADGTPTIAGISIVNGSLYINGLA